MKFNKNKIVHNFVIWTFVILYLAVSVISSIHVVDFFKMSNNLGMSIFLAVAFELGAAASLAAIVVLEKMNKGIVWFLFILLTAFQSMGNSFYAYIHLKDFIGWIELFGLTDYDVIFQKRVLSIISGAILPVVALGFIKSLVDYIRPEAVVYANAYNNENERIENNKDNNSTEKKDTELSRDASVTSEVEPAYVNEPLHESFEKEIQSESVTDEMNIKEDTKPVLIEEIQPNIDIINTVSEVEPASTEESEFEKQLEEIKKMNEKEAEKEIIKKIVQLSDQPGPKIQQTYVEPRKIVKEKKNQTRSL